MGSPVPDAKAILRFTYAGPAGAVVHAGKDGVFAFRGEPLNCEITVEVPGFKTAVKTMGAGTGGEFNFGDIILRIGVGSGVSVEAVVSPALRLWGVGRTNTWLSVADLAKLPQQIVKTADHGASVTFQGVLLRDALAKVDLPTGEKFHSTAASYYVVVEGQDGYRAVFAWAELDPAFMDKAVYVVTKRDGKPLPGKDGPFQLVVPGEKRAARWVRQVTAVRVQQAN
jgi:hypothetical protein